MARNIPIDDAQIVNLAILSHTEVKVGLQIELHLFRFIFNLYLNPYIVPFNQQRSHKLKNCIKANKRTLLKFITQVFSSNNNLYRQELKASLELNSRFFTLMGPAVLNSP